MEKIIDSATFDEKGQKITEQLLDNEESIYNSAKNIDKKGLQQFYTPPEIAEQLTMIFNLYENDNPVIVDLTAGNGILLKPFLKYPKVNCVGIEIDNGNIPRSTSKFKIFNADVTKFAPMLRNISLLPSIYVLNPPFNLDWQNENNEKVESQKYIFDYAIETLDYENGAGYIITSRTFYERYIRKNYKRNVVAVIICKNLFSNAAVESAITIFQPRACNLDTEIYYYDRLNGPIPGYIIEQINTKIGYKNYSQNYFDFETLKDCYKQYKIDNAKRHSSFNIDIEGNSLYLNLTNYKWGEIRNSYEESVIKNLMGIHGKTPRYLAFNVYIRKDVKKLIRDNMITMSPKAIELVEKAELDSVLTSTPFKELPPQQRLGYLQDIEVIKCKKQFSIMKNGKDWSDGGMHFEAGAEYPIKVKTDVHSIVYPKNVERKIDGEYITSTRNFSKQIKTLKITIGITDASSDVPGLELSETPEDIKKLIDYFEIPDPQDLEQKFPEQLTELEKEVNSPKFNAYTLKPYQKYDITRAALKDALILALSQGLGKSRLALVWAQLKKAKKTLIVCPQDLKKQWIQEAFKFGIRFRVINSYDDVLNAAQAKEGYWITHYEFLSIIDTVRETTHVWDVNEVKILNPGEEKPKYEIREHIFYSEAKVRHFMHFHGGTVKERNAFIKRFDGYSKFLKNCFDTIVLDEGVKIKTKNSLRGIAVRRLKAKNKIILSGDPIKNIFVDLYYLFGWLFGYNSVQFPYQYADRQKFLNDFGTFEKEQQPKEEKERPPRLLAEINNLSLFWKLTSSAILRRRTEETGEKMVAKRVHRIPVEFSETQNRQYAWWSDVDNFMDWFEARHPDSDVNKANAKFKGQLWKLRFTATIPTSSKISSPDTFLNDSAYTNKVLMTCELVRNVLLKNEQVVIFTNLQDSAIFLKRIFGSKAQIANGTLNPRARAEVSDAFKRKQFPILIAGTEAMNLGHSFENAQSLIMFDYIWEHSTTRQAIQRIYRLVSQKDVDIYFIYVKGSWDEIMLEIIDVKGMSSDLALDGKLTNQDENEIDYRALLKKTIELYRKLKKDSFAPEKEIEKECFKILQEINHTNTARIIEFPKQYEYTKPQQISLFG